MIFLLPDVSKDLSAAMYTNQSTVYFARAVGRSNVPDGACGIPGTVFSSWRLG